MPVPGLPAPEPGPHTSWPSASPAPWPPGMFTASHALREGEINTSHIDSSTSHIDPLLHIERGKIQHTLIHQI